MTEPGALSDHITPYDRLALPEPMLIGLLAAPTPNEGLVEYFGAALHAQLVTLARAALANPPGPAARRVYVLPGIMGSQLGLVRGGGRPNDILWLDPIDIQVGRITELRFDDRSRVVALGAMNYSYLKLTLSLRVAGYDAVLLDYDWRQSLATLGRRLAERLDADDLRDVAIVGHSMGGLVARAALTHAAGERVGRVVLLGTPNSGSMAAVQALRGTYSVVRKIAQLDLRHDAEFLAREVFSTFPGLHELLPYGPGAGDLDLFDDGAWPRDGFSPRTAMLRASAQLADRLGRADSRFDVVVGCNRLTATGVSLPGGELEYAYGQQGDGTVPMALACLDGARNSYIDCGHSEMPLDERVIGGTLELLATGATAKFAADAPRIDGPVARVRDDALRALHPGKVDWPHMTPAERRRFLDTLNEPPGAALTAR
ncbi:MAG TPA: alpha/beta fold hydrolase [Steroidobacteraceae bacterium]|nr:alpha/beta fold hydrolase [Steroidobacteraceae bacterium]